MDIGLATVLITALLGSAHCGAMCGPLLALAAPNARASGARRFADVGAWQTGRLAGYLLLGALAGALGGAVAAAGRLVGMQRAALVLSGVVLVAGGAIALRDALSPRGVVVAPHGPFLRAVRFVVRGRGEPTLVRAFSVGALTALLPCGWLWAFVTIAAGSGSAVRGASVLATFWLGTLPVLVLVAAGARRLLALGPRTARVVVALVLVAAGVSAIVGRGRLVFIAPHAPPAASAPVDLDPSHAACCHDAP